MVSRIQDEKSNLKVVDAVLEYPTGGTCLFNLGKYPDGTSPRHGTQRLSMKMENGTTEYMEYYGDEIHIGASEVIGKTLNEAWQVFYDKDKAVCVMNDITAIVVHNGESHVDEVIATAVAMMIIGHSVPVYRRNPSVVELKDVHTLVMDVGREYNPDLMNFDHHQRNREEEPKCSFRLFLEYFGLWDEFSKMYPWLPLWSDVDVTGPFAVSKKLGITPNTFFQILGPLYDIMRKMFEDSEKTPKELGDEVFNKITKPMFIQKLHCRVMMLKNAKIYVNGQNVRVMDVSMLKHSEVDTSLIPLVNNGEKCDVVILPPNERNKGLTMLRLDDSPKLDFSNPKIKEFFNDYIEFAHAGGFILVTKDVIGNGLIADILGTAWTGKE